MLLLMLASVWVSGSAQNKETLKERVERWKNDMAEFNAGCSGDEQARNALDTLSWLQAERAFEDSAFVLEADAVIFKYGQRVHVNSTTNFISMKGDRAVIQISPSYVFGGPNGVGGITVEGTVSNVRRTSDRKGRITFSMDVTGRGVNASVRIYAYPGSDRVLAEVSPTFNSNNVRLEGRIVPYEFSRTFEGTSL